MDPIYRSAWRRAPGVKWETRGGQRPQSVINSGQGLVMWLEAEIMTESQREMRMSSVTFLSQTAELSLHRNTNQIRVALAALHQSLHHWISTVLLQAHILSLYIEMKSNKSVPYEICFLWKHSVHTNILLINPLLLIDAAWRASSCCSVITLLV